MTKQKIIDLFGYKAGRKLYNLLYSSCANFCCMVKDCLGISSSGSATLYLNQQGNWSASTGPQGPQGPQGLQGIQGIQGIQGPVGAALTVLGSYPNLASFLAGPGGSPGNPGEAWIIESDGSLYVWHTITNTWDDVGDLQGPQGLQGVQGIQGIQGIQGLQGIQGVQGPQGLSGFEWDPTRISPNQYLIGDIVNYLGNYYICIANNDALIPPSTLGVYWNTYSFVGPQGPQGIQGIQGVPGPVGMPGLFAQTANSSPITGTTVETTLINGGVGTLSVPANGFQIGDSFRAIFGGVMSVANNQTIRIRIRTNGSVLLDSGVQPITNITNGIFSLNIDFTIRQLGGAGTASIVSLGSFHYNKTSNATVEGFGFNVVNNTTFDTTINNTLNVTVQWGSNNATNNIYSDIFILNKTY